MAAEFTGSLNAEHYDMLRELGNIGMGSAASALSTMINSPTDISVPDVRLISAADASKLLTIFSGGALAMVINISGDICGKLLHIIPAPFAQRVISTYYEKQISSWDDLNDMDMSVISEMTNIVSAQFCNALSEQLSMFVDISTPLRSVNLAADTIDTGGMVIFENMTLVIKDGAMKEFIIFIPDGQSVVPLLARAKQKEITQIRKFPLK